MRPGCSHNRPAQCECRRACETACRLAAAEEEANVIGNALRPPRPATEPPLTKPRFALLSLHDEIVEPVRPALRVFLVAVAVVLLIVCANVANLLLARGASRSRELAVRLAVGAGRARLVRQIFTECLVLSAVGGALGAALGAAGVQLVKQLATIDAQGVFRLSFGGDLLPRINEVGVDGRVLMIAVGLSIVCSVVFGLFPALHLSRVSQLQAMGSRSGGSTPRRDADAHGARPQSAGARHRAARDRGAAREQLHEPVAGGKGLRPGKRARVPARAAAGIRDRAQGRHH